MRDVDVWIEFNDESVRKVSKSEAVDSNFGDGGTYSNSAYMLVYMRKSLLPSLMKKVEVPHELADRIEEDRKERSTRHLYDTIHSFVYIATRVYMYMHEVPVCMRSSLIRVVLNQLIYVLGCVYIDFQILIASRMTKLPSLMSGVTYQMVVARLICMVLL